MRRPGNGHVDALARLRRVDQYQGVYASVNWSATRYASSKYEYDVLDRLTDVYGPGANVILDTNNHIQISYDALGRKTSMTDPDMGAWSYAYDAAGNLKRQTDARRWRICFYYNALNRLTGKTFSTGSGACPADLGYNGYAIGYYYDESGYGASLGRRTRVVTASTEGRWTYDARGRVTREEKKINGTWYTTQWSYDAADRVRTMTYPDNKVVTYTYNSQGLVESAVGSSTYVQNTDYDPLGRVELRKLGNDVLRQDPVYYAWTTVNRQGRLKQIKVGTPSDTTSLQDLRYSYDAAGNVLSIQDWRAGTPQTQSFSYDELDRLVAAVTSGGSSGSYNESYSYDKAGNLTSKTGVGSYAYGVSASNCQSGTPASKPHAVTTAGTYSFSYDCNGNITQRNVGSNYTLSYDTENRLASVSGAASASFVYDGDGSRIEATFGVTTTLYVGD